MLVCLHSRGRRGQFRPGSLSSHRPLDGTDHDDGRPRRAGRVGGALVAVVLRLVYKMNKIEPARDRHGTYANGDPAAGRYTELVPRIRILRRSKAKRLIRSLS